MKRTSAAVLALSALALAAPAGAQTLRIGLQEDPDMLDPHRARTFVGRIVFTSLCDKLVDIDTKLQFVPRLATEWSFSEDGKTLTMKLRAGVKFHDGEPFDAAAVKANIERAKTLPDSVRKSEVASIESITAVDPLTVRITLSRPDATLISQLSDRSGMMLSPKSLGGDVSTKPVCSGPYSFVERVQNDRIVLQRFADHWEAKNYSFERIVFRSIPDTTVRLANLRSGELDMLERLAATDIKTATGDRSLKVMSAIGIGYQGMTLNILNTDAAGPLGKDKRIRQALSLAIDREVLNQAVFEGTHPPAIQPFPPASPYYMKELVVPKRDVAAAKALLKAAGHEKITLEALVTNNPIDQQTGQVIQAMVAEAGIELKLKATEFASQLREQQQGRFQISRVGWSGRVDPDGNIHQFVTCKGGLNDGKYCNAEVDKLLDEARVTYDPVKRKALYDKAQTILNDEIPIMYLFYQPWVWAMKAKLDGFVASPDGMIRLAGVKLLP